MRAEYKEINDWNAVATNQPIQLMCLFRWFTGEPNWSISDKPEVANDFRGAMQNEYLVRLPSAPATTLASPTPTIPATPPKRA